MKRYVIEYLALVLVLMGWDAISSVGGRVRYQFLWSLFCSLAWPVALPIAIFIAARRTRHYPEGPGL